MAPAADAGNATATKALQPSKTEASIFVNPLAAAAAAAVVSKG